MKRFLVLMYILFSTVSFTCSHSPRRFYDSASNAKLEKLNELQKSILKITCSAFYQNYFYSYPDTISQEAVLYDKNKTTSSVAGTGLIIYKDLHSMVLLTCHHVFDFKDTLKTYYLNGQKQPTKFLSSFSVKLGQNILVFHKNGRSSKGKIIAMDEANDIVLIEISLPDILLTEFPFQGSFGDAEKLKLGQEVYLLGFPRGFFMVTRGLASPAPFKNKFLVDAPFNNGFSGGVAIVFNDDQSQYQYVGMANAVAYNSEIVLAPANDLQFIEKYKNLPYSGDIFIKDLKLINYGLTFVIKSNVIIDFLELQRKRLRKLGYNFPVYIKE